MHFINKIFVLILLVFSVLISKGQAAKKPVAKPAASKTQITVKAKPKVNHTKVFFLNQNIARGQVSVNNASIMQQGNLLSELPAVFCGIL